MNDIKAIHSPFDTDINLLCVTEKESKIRDKSFVLEFSGTRFLLECGLELEKSIHFTPTHFPFPFPCILPPPSPSASVTPFPSSKSLPLKRRSFDLSKEQNELENKKRIKISHNANKNKIKNKNESETESLKFSSFLNLNGQILINGAPKYFFSLNEFIHSYNIDVILISNPYSMLGLPFIDKNIENIKVFATEATVKMARLMMKELISLDSLYSHHHHHHRQSIAAIDFPRSYQSNGQLDASILSSLPNELSKYMEGKSKYWKSLYSMEDVEASLSRVNCLSMKEVVDIGTGVSILPVSSGSSFGCCNWSIKSQNQQFKIAYVSSSLIFPTHSTPLDLKNLNDCDLVIFNEPSFLHTRNVETSNPSLSEFDRKRTRSQHKESLAEKIKSKSNKVNEFDWKETKTQCDESVLRKDSTDESAYRKVGKIKSNEVKSKLLRETSQKSQRMKYMDSHEMDGCDSKSFFNWSLSFDEICDNVIRTVIGGGNVLIPVVPGGMLLEMIESISMRLDKEDLTNIPMIYASSIAEEFFDYCNTIPEWVAETRVNRMYDNANALFDHVKLLKNKRLKFVPNFMSSNYVKEILHSSCIVFASDLFLRMGSSLDLFCFWCLNSKNAMIYTNPSFCDLNHLLPCELENIKMKILHIPVYSTLTHLDMIQIANQVKSSHVLFSDSMDELLSKYDPSSSSFSFPFSFYEEGSVINLQFPPKEIKVHMKEQELRNLQPILSHYSYAKAFKVNANLHIQTNPWRLRTLSPGSALTSKLTQTFCLENLQSKEEASSFFLLHSAADCEALINLLRRFGFEDVARLGSEVWKDVLSEVEKEWLRVDEVLMGGTEKVGLIMSTVPYRLVMCVCSRQIRVLCENSHARKLIATAVCDLGSLI